MNRPDPIYFVIYLFVLAAVGIFGWDFFSTRRPERKKRRKR